VYKARETLYPRRSQKLLFADIEYLLAPMDVIQTTESLRNYVDSLNGFMLRDEQIPYRAVAAIESYLTTLFRQRRTMRAQKKV
jgi:hypothetical protein